MKPKIIAMLLVCVLAVPLVCAAQFFLQQDMEEGETKNYKVGELTYKVTVTAVFDSQLKAQFEVNGEKGDVLGEDESHKFSDGTVIQLRSVLPQESGDGKDLVQFNLFPSKDPSAAMSGKVGVAAEPEPAAAETKTDATVSPEPTTVSAAPEKGENEPAGEIQPAPTKGEAKIDITREKPNTSWWESMLSWLKNLFS
ncbi:hypothetical protein ACFL3V_04230 [Nanoarchaeota archaeon]